MTKRMGIFFLTIFIFLFNSCVILIPSSMRTVRNEIKRNNPRVTAVGVITDWTNSDDNYIAVELKLEDDKTLFLPLVDYRKRKNYDPFHVNRVGNYAFATVTSFVNKETNQSEVQLRTNVTYNLQKLSANINIQIKTMNDIINYYDDINNYVESLPTVDEYNYQEIFEKGILVIDNFRENETYFISEYCVKTIWDDKYYGVALINGKLQARRPDYDNNVFFTGYRLLGYD